jgi:hypothetical protein
MIVCLFFYLSEAGGLHHEGHGAQAGVVFGEQGPVGFRPPDQDAAVCMVCVCFVFIGGGGLRRKEVSCVCFVCVCGASVLWWRGGKEGVGVCGECKKREGGVHTHTCNGPKPKTKTTHRMALGTDTKIKSHPPSSAAHSAKMARTSSRVCSSPCRRSWAPTDWAFFPVCWRGRGGGGCCVIGFVGVGGGVEVSV